MLRARLVLAAGYAMFLLACLAGGCLPALLKPQHPYYDVEAQQAEYYHQLGWLLGSAGVLLVCGCLLTRYGRARLRHQRSKADLPTPHGGRRRR